MHMQVDIDEHPVQVCTRKAPPLTQYYLKKALHYETLYIYQVAIGAFCESYS